MKQELRDRLQAIFDCVEGGSSEDMYAMLDAAIDDGELTHAEARENEMDIAHFFDSQWFTCTACNWTLPISDISYIDNSELICRECLPEENE